MSWTISGDIRELRLVPCVKSTRSRRTCVELAIGRFVLCLAWGELLLRIGRLKSIVGFVEAREGRGIYEGDKARREVHDQSGISIRSHAPARASSRPPSTSSTYAAVVHRIHLGLLFCCACSCAVPASVPADVLLAPRSANAHIFSLCQPSTLLCARS